MYYQKNNSWSYDRILNIDRNLFNGINFDKVQNLQLSDRDNAYRSI